MQEVIVIGHLHGQVMQIDIHVSRIYGHHVLAQIATTKYYRHLVLMFLKARSLRTGCVKSQVPVIALFLACRLPSSHCVLAWQTESQQLSGLFL